jgi:hypothetical protein
MGTGCEPFLGKRGGRAESHDVGHR